MNPDNSLPPSLSSSGTMGGKELHHLRSSEWISRALRAREMAVGLSDMSHAKAKR